MSEKTKTEGPDLDLMAAEVLAAHERLTAEFLDTQREAEEKWARHQAASDRLTAFREKWGSVVRALESGVVRVKQ